MIQVHRSAVAGSCTFLTGRGGHHHLAHGLSCLHALSCLHSRPPCAIAQRIWQVRVIVEAYQLLDRQQRSRCSQ